jgi:hypothetical protein
MVTVAKSRTVVVQDNRLDLLDQATWLSMRATGRGQLMQTSWVYEHPVDLDAVRRFHANIGQGLLGRRIERSPLPFGRHRWVSTPGPSSGLDIAECPRPRAEFSDWADERAELPIDPETGPGWHIGVLPLTDGSTAISLVMSHCLADGVGALLTIADAANGERREFGYPPPQSRRRLRTALADVGHLVLSLPSIARALGIAAMMAVLGRHDAATPAALAPGTLSVRTPDEDADRIVVVPAVTVFVDAVEWDSRANALGGNSYSLLAGFAAQLAERMERRAADGTISLLVAVSDRTPDDKRAIAMSMANVSVDPKLVTVDLSGARAALKSALQKLRVGPVDSARFLSVIPLVPVRAVKRGAEAFFGFAGLPVSCSNLGDLDPAVGCPDGTPAEYVYLRGVDRPMTRREHDRAKGQLVVVSGRIGGKVTIGVAAYQPGGDNSKPALRALAMRALAEFDLTGELE